MDDAGLLNSMTVEQLRVTCSRLQRSHSDMQMLLQEFQAEQVLLRREQDRLHQTVDRVAADAERREKVEEHNILWSVMSEVDRKLEVSQLFKAKEERKAAKRRRWARNAEAGGGAHAGGAAPRAAGRRVGGARGAASQAPEDLGPFSDVCVRMSWGSDASLGKLRQHPAKAKATDLEQWVREVVCGDPVAEAEPLTESAQVWGAQFGGPGPDQAGRRQDAPRSGEVRFGELRQSPRGSLPDLSADPLRSPPITARRSRPEAGSSPKGGGHATDGEGGTDFGESLMSSIAHNAAPQVIGRRLAAPLTHLATFADTAADWASNLLPPAEPTASRRDESPQQRAVVSLKVVLKRSGDDRRWGLAWEMAGFKATRERVVSALQPGSVAESWNRLQEQSGAPHKMILPGDRLLSANGRTSPDDIKAELSGREVVLEFRRVVRRPSSPSAFFPVGTPAGADPRSPAAASSPAKPPPQGKRAFQAAFSDYLKVVAPAAVSGAPPEGEQRPPHQEKPDRELGERPLRDGEPPTRPPALSPRSMALAMAAEDEEEEAALDEPPPPPSERPEGLLVQVLSLSSGTLRLSWLFDWAAAPADQPRAERRYFIVQRREEDGEELRHGPFEQPVATLEVPTGRRYVFEVSAALLDDGSAAWTSPPSPAVGADLRNGRGADEAAAQESPKARPRADDVEDAAPAQARRRSVASSLGSFLARRPAAEEVRAWSPTSRGDSAPTSPSGVGAPSGVVMGPAPSRGMTSAVSMLDPIRDRRDVTELLRMRRGGSAHASPGKPDSTRQRSASFDSDDEGSLVRLAGALGALERTTAAVAAARQAVEHIAEEGHHSLQERLDHPRGAWQPLRPAGKAGGAQSAAAAAAAFARGHFAHDLAPVAKPAQDSEGEPGWANLGDADPPSAPLPGGGAASPTFALSLQIADSQVVSLTFGAEDDLAARVREFIARHGMKEVFEDPLVARAGAMVAGQRFEDSVDIVDLLD